ncbi:MAG TPA: BamA/TamA family outer membrane protein [Steroidobacteraceae bacterium]|nr:BamA/TamA family outer membrane protein [Steroidobacteraceae bacterium]
MRGDGDDAGQVEAPAQLSFKVAVVSDNRRIARHLERYLDIQRFTDFPDLQLNELRRLLGEVEANARDLLAAQGYFQPTLELRTGEADADPDAPRQIVIEVDPGEPAKVADLDIGFAAPATDPDGQRQRESVIEAWPLQEGDAFTQIEWDAAKSTGLRELQRERYPTAHIASSLAIVRAATSTVDLEVEYDTGPLYRFGALELQGVERYNAEGIRNIARIPTGADYSELTLLEAQQRLVGSGYFDSAFLVLDTSTEEPQQAKVIAQLREATYQKLVFGLGYSTDAGPRVSVDHSHNRMWPLRWRALNQVAVGTETQSLATHWTAMPAASGWAWNTGATLSRSAYGDFTANSVSVTGGRARSADRTERRYYGQYDASAAEGGDAPGGSSSILGNYAWTGRYFDNPTSPVRGRGWGVEAGIGFTLTPDRDPFVRTKLRGLQLLPIGRPNAAGRRSRLVLRAEAGAIYAADDVRIPVPLLVLTGGDTTVRGYSYHSIGNRLDDGSTYGSRYMTLGSVEWQRPISLFGDGTTWEHTLFVDAGAASDTFRDAVVHTGVGTGMRWSSPVGPLQADVAYGTRDHRWRLHLRVGFQF